MTNEFDCAAKTIVFHTILWYSIVFGDPNHIRHLIQVRAYWYCLIGPHRVPNVAHFRIIQFVVIYRWVYSVCNLLLYLYWPFSYNHVHRRR